MILICGGDCLLHGGADGGCVLFHGGDDEKNFHCSDRTLPFFWKMHVVAPGLESVPFAALGLESVSLAALGLESVFLVALALQSVSLAILILILILTFQVGHGCSLAAG